MNRFSIPGMVNQDQASVLVMGSRFFPLWYHGRSVKLSTLSSYGIEVKNDVMCAVGRLYLPHRVHIGSPVHTAYPRLGTLSWAISRTELKEGASSH